jgi:hypothetical protein
MSLRMLNLRFKNPYKLDSYDEDNESKCVSFVFGDLVIHEFDKRKELAPKGKIC